MRTEFVLDALEQALHARRSEPHQLIYHSDRGRNTCRFATAND